MNLHLPSRAELIAGLSWLGGVAGVICGAVGAGGLSGPIEQVITGVSGLLVAIGAHHATSVVAARATASAVPRPPAIP